MPLFENASIDPLDERRLYKITSKVEGQGGCIWMMISFKRHVCFIFASYVYFQDKGFNVTLRDETRSMGMISLQGPKSRAILQSLTNADLSNEAFPFSTNQIIQVSGRPVSACVDVVLTTTVTFRTLNLYTLL